MLKAKALRIHRQGGAETAPGPRLCRSLEPGHSDNLRRRAARIRANGINDGEAQISKLASFHDHDHAAGNVGKIVTGTRRLAIGASGRAIHNPAPR
jgi:hypothetical protein